MSYGYGHRSCGCGPTRRRRSTRVVYGCSTPCFTVKIGEVVDVVIDLSDEVYRGDEIVTATPVPEFVSVPDGSATLGVVVASIMPPQSESVEILINAENPGLVAGEVWKVPVQVALSDGRRFVRSFSVKLAETGNPVCVATTTTTDTTTTVTPGQIISGSGATIPATLSAGLFTLTAPFGATFATVQFHTVGVWTVTGATPSDINSVGNQVLAGTTVTLSTRNEIDSFRFTGTNDGADDVQVFAEYYTANPNP